MFSVDSQTPSARDVCLLLSRVLPSAIMGAKREHTLVVDFSILPKRPDPSDAEKFIFGELKLDLSDVTNIQFHNVRNVVYIEMVDDATAVQYHNDHHLRRIMKLDNQEFKIPVYMEDGAVNVRVHDLPPQTPNAVLKEHLKHYGTILSINREVWRNYFPGVFNGVRVVRMQLTKPIPSYQTIDGETTLVTYRNQTKTCRFCACPAHPRQKCGIKSNPANDTNNNTNPAQFTATDFPALGGNEERQQKKQQQQQKKSNRVERSIQPVQQSPVQQSQSISGINKSDNVEAIDSGSASESDEYRTDTNKRRLSTNHEGNDLKRTTANQSCQENNGRKIDEMENNVTESSGSTSPAVTRSRSKKTTKIV